MAVAAAMVYGSFFIFLSLVIKKAVLVGIILAIGIDGFLAYVPMQISNISMQVHLRNLMSAISGETRFRQMLEGVNIDVHPGYSILVLFCVCLVFVSGGMIAFRRKQFV
jgi:hypothetical protein